MYRVMVLVRFQNRREYLRNPNGNQSMTETLYGQSPQMKARIGEPVIPLTYMKVSFNILVSIFRQMRLLMSKQKQSREQPTRKMCEFPAESDSEELKILANNPAYICMDCGKSAASEENLCKPEYVLFAVSL